MRAPDGTTSWVRVPGVEPARRALYAMAEGPGCRGPSLSAFDARPATFYVQYTES